MGVKAAEIEKFLRGTQYPASKNDLNKQARDNQAPDIIIDLINNLPQRRFNSPMEVSRAIEEIE
ncbi:MAG TPA: DUF2795 domain-containing protein [Deltaproteobacteria bacterium]|jgi:hypothetical protein|nr:DUF2795 domain-containing protein [Deltaproteobacteria bacterium]HOI06689.1 DUF2795 domain-containing protein [Deltaproteobacteria bacterium]